MPSLWLVDRSHTIFRAYHALPHLSTRQGVPTNAVYGFTTMLLRAIREGSPTHLAVAFDEEAKAKRSEIYHAYKATRGAPPDDLMPQFPLVRQVLEAMRVPAIGFPGYEADDVIATLAKRARAQGWEVVIVSGDKDLMQLEDLERKPIDEPRARQLFSQLEFVRLVNDLPRPPPTPPSGARSIAATVEEVQRVIDKARARGRFAILTLTSEDEPLRDDLLGLAISLPDESVYVPLGHRPAGGGGSGALFAPAEINAKRAIPLLKPLLEDPGIIKDGHDLKRDVDAWRRLGVNLKGLGIDSRIASYLIDPTGRDHSLVQTARDRISCELPLLKELCERSGNGKNATPLAELPVDVTGAAAAALVEGARRLTEALGEDLRGDPELLGLYTDIEKPLIEV